MPSQRRNQSLEIFSFSSAFCIRNKNFFEVMDGIKAELLKAMKDAKYIITTLLLSPDD